MVREPPAYTVFVAGFIIVGVCGSTAWLAWLWLWRLFITLHIPHLPPCLLAFFYVGAIVWVLSFPSLAMLAVFDTCSSPTIHFYSAYVFFSFAFVGMLCTAVGTIMAASRYAGPESGPVATFLKSSKVAKAVLLGVFAVCASIYLPVGLAVVCNWEYLSQDECITKGLGKDYCTTPPIQTKL